MWRTRALGWWKRWAITSLCAATIATALDAALLQRTRSYFTGGFLAADSLTTAGQTAAFLAGSLIADLGITALITAVVLMIAGRAGAVPFAASVVAVFVAVVTLATANVVEYELASYLGDAFDLRLMFDLAGRDVREVLAVSSAHLTSVFLVGALSVAAVLVAFAWARWRRKHRDPWEQVPRLARVAFAVTAALLVAASVTTAMRRASDVLDNGLRRKPSGQWLGMAVNRLSDVDGDGFGVLGRPPDQALFDGRIRPYARDLPGNGVDEDGVAGDLPANAQPYQERPVDTAPWAMRPDVILVVLESFRADALGSRVNGKPVTPVLDQLAARGVSSVEVFSHNGYTVQARRHIFSGSIADLRGGGTLIDDFKANGYETAYFSGQDESFGGATNGVGFERADVAYDARADRDRRYSAFTTPGSLAVPNGLVLERITQFLERRQRSRPLFLYANFHDTHFPYHHAGIEPLIDDMPLAQASIAPARAAALRTTYLNTAANVDRAIGRLLDQARRFLGREPGVIVIGDHGESLFDEGFLGHGYALNDAQTRVPLVVAGLPMTLVEPVGQADLRDAINVAMMQTPGGAGPRMKRDESREIFQYLGTIERPAQIKLTGLKSQISYDFRSGRARAGAGSWVVPEALPGPAVARWRALVTMWERMIIARTDRHGEQP